MEKVIIVLTGASEGKITFISTIKENGWWTWNINPANRLSSLTYELGWDGERNKNYFDFIQKFESIANIHFDFKNRYVENLIKKFNDNEKVNVLIIHNVDEDMGKVLQEQYSNCFSVHITDRDLDNVEYCKVLNFKDVKYPENILEVMKALTKDMVAGE